MRPRLVGAVAARSRTTVDSERWATLHHASSALTFGNHRTTKTALTFAVLAAVGIALLMYLKTQGFLGGKRTERWPFYVKKPFTQPEQILYNRLIKALSENIALAQIQVSRVFGVHRRSNFMDWNNRVNRMRCDFVICA